MKRGHGIWWVGGLALLVSLALVASWLGLLPTASSDGHGSRNAFPSLRATTQVSGDERALRPLAGDAALPTVDSEAARPLRTSSTPATELDLLIEQLVFGQSVDNRVDAAMALSAWVPGDAETALANASRVDPEPEVREAALDSLLDAGSDIALRAYAEAFDDPDEWVSLAAENGLYDHPDITGSQGVLAGYCASEDRELRIRAAELLDEMSPEQIPWDEISEGPTTFSWATAVPVTGAK